MQDTINQIKNEFLGKIGQAKSLPELDQIYLDLFGKNGVITVLPRNFPTLTKEELKVIGTLFNRVKQELEKAIEKRRIDVKEEAWEKLILESWNPKAEVKIKKRVGHIHPTSEFQDQIVELFQKLGFQQYDSPQIDTDYYNFEVLNIPAEHPARDLWDTLYIENSNSDTLLLRTHTSNSQIRIMKEFKPPIRMMVLGPCFRYENLDARHEHTFDQFELVYVDKGLSMANLQYLSEYFLKSVLGEDIKVRLKPKYYPFVEPGVGIDGLCMFCKGEGCKICGGIGWLELGGAGMIHPTVLKNGGIDPEEYSGIAWGPGLQRILMLMKNVKDLRLFRSGDLKFLQSLEGKDESK